MHMPAPAPSVLVGRERELAILRDRVTGAVAGHGGLVLIGGEAGIGKTTLAETVCREAEAKDALVLVGRCYDLTETPPYGPWVDLFARYQPGDQLPALPLAFAQRGTVSAVASQAALLRQVVDFFVASAVYQPVVLFLDDLQWADPASLDLLRSLAQSVADVPLLILITYRSDELTRRHPLYRLLPLLVRETKAERLDLHRLDDAEVRALVSGRYTLAETDLARLVGYLQVRAEGNALFVGELLRSLQETGVLRQRGDGWELGALSDTTVPPLLRQVIDGRLDRLDGEAQRLLSVAALIGHTVPLDLWATVGEVGEEALADAVERGTEARLLMEMGDSGFVQFAHALIREALYEAVPAPRRRRIHRQVGETLAERTNPDPDAVADHFQRAGDPRAAAWLIRGGERAERAYAWITAAARFEAALAAMAGYDADTGERGWLLLRLALMLRYTDPQRGIAHLGECMHEATATANRPLAAIAPFLRGMLRCYAQNLREGLTEMEAGSAAERALSPADRALLKDHLIRLALADDTDGRGTLALWRAITGRHTEAREMAEQSLATSSTPTVAAVGASNRGDAFAGLTLAYAALGLPDEAVRAAARARETYQAIGHHSLVAGSAMQELIAVTLPYRADRPQELQHAVATAEEALTRAGSTIALPPRLAHLPLLYLRGEWAEARRVAVAGPIMHHTVLSIRSVLGPLARAQGDRELAWTQVRETLPDGPDTEPGDTPFLTALAMQRLAAALALDDGDRATAFAWLVAHDRWLAWGGATLGQSEGQLGWATYDRLAGDREAAQRHAVRALVHATEPRQPLALLAAHRLLGELATDTGRADEARAHLDASLALADACAAPFERALTLLARAHLDAVTGRQANAGTLLDEVRTICTPLDARPVRDHADTFASRLADMGTAPPTFPAGLSAREVEVLRLVADGLTNAQVAERLFLSPHTINAHLTTIYSKLAVPSRAAAIRFALDHGLR